MELMIVIVVIGILAAVGMVYFSKSTTAAQTAAIKSQNDEIYNFIKLKTQTQCLKYSDQLSLSFINKWGQTKTFTSVCNSNWGQYNGAWHVVNKMHYAFNGYFTFNSDFYKTLKNPIPGTINKTNGAKNPYSLSGSCPNLSSLRQTMSPGMICISYEGNGSRQISGDQCINQGYEAWILIVSVLPDDALYVNCVGKTW